MSLKPDNTNYWDERHGRIFSRNGGWFVGKAVLCHGHNMLEELVGQVSYFQVMMLNILGKLPDRRLADWLEALHICLSWPDPRIWCNQIGALAGDSRTTATAASISGILAADSVMYGQYTFIKGAEFIQTALLRHTQLGLTAADIISMEVQRNNGKMKIMGYARPLASGDERIAAMERVTKQLGFKQGDHLHLAYEIEKYLQRNYSESMNINGYMTAFLSDQGLSPENIYRICALLVASGVTACYVDARDRPAGSFLPLRCDDIDYQGKPPRPVPERE